MKFDIKKKMIAAALASAVTIGAGIGVSPAYAGLSIVLGSSPISVGEKLASASPQAA